MFSIPLGLQQTLQQTVNSAVNQQTQSNAQSLPFTEPVRAEPELAEPIMTIESDHMNTHFNTEADDEEDPQPPENLSYKVTSEEFASHDNNCNSKTLPILAIINSKYNCPIYVIMKRAIYCCCQDRGSGRLPSKFQNKIDMEVMECSRNNVDSKYHKLNTFDDDSLSMTAYTLHLTGKPTNTSINGFRHVHVLMNSIPVSWLDGKPLKYNSLSQYQLDYLFEKSPTISLEKLFRSYSIYNDSNLIGFTLPNCCTIRIKKTDDGYIAPTWFDTVKTPNKINKKLVQQENPRVEDVDEVESADDVDEVESADDVDEVESADDVDEVESADDVDEVESADDVDEVESADDVDEVESADDCQSRKTKPPPCGTMGSQGDCADAMSAISGGHRQFNLDLCNAQLNPVTTYLHKKDRKFKFIPDCAGIKDDCFHPEVIKRAFHKKGFNFIKLDLAKINLLETLLQQNDKRFFIHGVLNDNFKNDNFKNDKNNNYLIGYFDEPQFGTAATHPEHWHQTIAVIDSTMHCPISREELGCESLELDKNNKPDPDKGYFREIYDVYEVSPIGDVDDNDYEPPSSKKVVPKIQRQSQTFPNVDDTDEQTKQTKCDRLGRKSSIVKSSTGKRPAITNPSSSSSVIDGMEPVSKKQATDQGTRPLESLSVAEVGTLLGHLDLGRYSDLFAAESVNGAHLMEVEEDDLKEMGMKLGMHRKAFLKQVALLKMSGVPVQQLIEQ